MKERNEKVFSEFLKEGIIVKLNEFEKERYIGFFNDTYKDNLETAKDNLKKHPRWSIIAGYYSMHDLAKLFLAKHYGLKITTRVHFATIVALSYVLKQDKEKLRLTKLLKEAREMFDENILGKKPEDIVAYLKKGKSERGKTQYYTKRIEKNVSEKANYFINQIVTPFIKMMEKLN